MDEPPVRKPSEVATLQEVVRRGVRRYTFHRPPLERFLDQRLAPCETRGLPERPHNFPTLLGPHYGALMGNGHAPVRHPRDLKTVRRVPGP